MYILKSFFIKIEYAAAKLLQSCPTLCDPIDGSPPGSSVHEGNKLLCLKFLLDFNSNSVSKTIMANTVSLNSFNHL